MDDHHDDFDHHDRLASPTGQQPSRQQAPSRRPHLSVTSPPDLVAAVAVALGFVPTESLVMLVLAPSAGPHARIDLPDPAHGDAAVRGVARVLAGAAVRNDVERVALVLFADVARAAALAPRLVEVMTGIGVDVAAVVSADGDVCSALRTSDGDGAGVVMGAEPYDVLGHRFVARAVADGLPVRRSRNELEDMLRSRADVVEQVAAHACLRCATPEQPVDVERMRQWTRRGARIPAARDPHLLRSLLDALDATAGRQPGIRDATWAWVTRAEADQHVDLWVAVVRAAGVGRATQAASVLAFHAWLAGQGALAWCALERVAEEGGSTSLATLVRDLMERAVPPGAWTPLDTGSVSDTTGRSRIRPGDAATSVVSLKGAATSLRE